MTARELVKFSRNTNLNNVRFYTQGSEENPQKDKKTDESNFNESTEKKNWKPETKIAAGSLGVAILALGNGVYQTHQKEEELKNTSAVSSSSSGWGPSFFVVVSSLATLAVVAAVDTSLGNPLASAIADSASDYFKKNKNKK